MFEKIASHVRFLIYVQAYCRYITRCISQPMEVRKASNSKSDLQAHSMSPVMVPFDKPYTISY